MGEDAAKYYVWSFERISFLQNFERNMVKI